MISCSKLAEVPLACFIVVTALRKPCRPVAEVATALREFRQPVVALLQPRGNPDGLLQEEQLIRGSCGSLLQVLQLLIC